MSKPEEMQQNSFDNGGDEELREDRGDFFEADESVEDVAKKQDPAEGNTDEGAIDQEAKTNQDAEGEDDKKGDKQRAVPYDRFNSLNEQKRLLEQQNELLRKMLEQAQAGKNDEAQQQEDTKTVQEFEGDAKKLRELRKELKEALYTDDESRYEEIQDEIDAINERRSRALVRAELEAEAAKSKASTEQRLFMDTAAKMVAQYPVLDAETGDPDAIKKVVALRDYYINNDRLSAAAALEKASIEIGELYSGGRSAEEGKASGDKRKAAAIERGVSEANTQPPPTSQAGVGSRAQSARLNVERMSEREFHSLPEEERARLRGDIV